MKIEVLPDDDAVARKAAAIIAADARAAVAARGRFIMAVSGGHTPWLMLRALADEQLPWEQVHVVQVDERVAPAAIRTETSRICAKACSIMHRCAPTTSMRCRSKQRTSSARLGNTPLTLQEWPGRRRCSISFISASVRTATPRRWCPAIRCSMSPTRTSR